jgi:hypothetical protein
MKQYKYFEIPYDATKDLLFQINEVCKRFNTRFHSMGQKVSPVRTMSGNPKVEIVLIFEVCENVPLCEPKN